MTDELDNQSASETEGELDTNLENGTELTVDDYNKMKTSYESQKVRAEKAERELKEFKSKQEKPTPKNDEPQSNEPDYAKLAFLETKGLTHPDDQKIVQDEAKRLNLPLTEILGMEHIKSKLSSAKSQREAEDGMPSGSGKGSSGVSKNTVDYWVNRKNPDGTYQTPEDTELAGKVIAARIKSEESKSMFEPIR